MVSKSKKPPPPFNLYHGVPAGWRVEEIIVRYKTLHGPLEKLTIDDISPVQSQWTQGQNLWVGYANALVFIGDGIVRNDHACVELAIDYIILDHCGSGSGYARSRFARRLKHAQLDRQQKARLCAHFERLCQSRTRRYEFRHYRMLGSALFRRMNGFRSQRYIRFSTRKAPPIWNIPGADDKYHASMLPSGLTISRLMGM